MQCKHGEMTPRSGEKNGKPWSGMFCPTPKGTPDQCQPIFTSSGTGGSAPTAKNGLTETLARLEEKIDRLLFLTDV